MTRISAHTHSVEISIFPWSTSKSKVQAFFFSLHTVLLHNYTHVSAYCIVQTLNTYMLKTHKLSDKSEVCVFLLIQTDSLHVNDTAVCRRKQLFILSHRKKLSFIWRLMHPFMCTYNQQNISTFHYQCCSSSYSVSFTSMH